MIQIDREQKTVRIQNQTILAEIAYGNGLRFLQLSNLYAPAHANCGREFFTLNIFDKDVPSSDFQCTDVSIARDEHMEMVTFLLENPRLCLQMRLHIINSGESNIHILYQLRDDYLEGVPSEIYFHVPFLSSLECGSSHETKYYPCNSVRDSSGQDVLRRMNETFFSSDIIMPFVVCDDAAGYGFSVDFPVYSDLSDMGSVQNVNYQLSRIADEHSLKNHKIRLGPDASFNDTVELVITGLKEGWPEAFCRNRDCWRSGYDFSEYQREDLKWFRDCAVHNFTFLYGAEGFDHNRNCIDTDRLLAEGDEFGGFDTVILWNQYPRLGIDERTQWDFYDDFPGGREAICKAVEKFHARGVKVLLPFIPWDRHEEESTNSMGNEMAQIAKDTGIDGFHLDTMKTLPYSVREKLDRVRPGIVLETQGHPMKKRAMEYITASWDEFWTPDPMPEADILRYIHPEHVAPAIGRWLRLKDKTTLIKRAEFNGTQIVIWQDIFGRWMPYTSQQKQRVKRWKHVFRTYQNIFLGKNPLPLYPTGTEDMFCNVFSDDNGQCQIYSFYNDRDQKTVTEALPLWHFKASEAKIILGDGSAELSHGKLSVSVPARECLQVLVTRKSE